MIIHHLMRLGFNTMFGLMLRIISTPSFLNFYFLNFLQVQAQEVGEIVDSIYKI